MNSIRKVLGFLMAAVMLAAFTLPAGAANPQKIYSMTVSPIGSAPVAVTITNETPNGNSTINSFIITPPSDATVIIHDPKSNRLPADVTMSGGKIYVKGFDGLKTGNQTPKFLTIYLDVNYAGGSSPACGTGNVWTAVVYTGNSFGNETFDQVDPVTKQLVVPANSGVTQSATCTTYTLAMSGGPVPKGVSSPTTEITATFTNDSTSTNAFGSLTLAPPSNFTVVGIVSPASASIVGGSVKATNLSIAPSGQYIVKMNVVANCDAITGNWTPTVYIGTSATGSTFSQNPASSLGTNVSGGCSLQFKVQPPGDVSVGSPAIAPPVEVGLWNGSAYVTSFTGPVSLGLTGPSGTLSGGGPVTPGAGDGGIAKFSGLTINGVTGAVGVGPYQLLATSGSYSQSSAPFMVFPGGLLQCEPAPPFTFSDLPTGVTNIDQPGYAAGQRGKYNKDGSQCFGVGYTFTNKILTDNPQTVTLSWDTSWQKGAAFEYTVTWRPEYVDTSTGWPVASRRTQVSWFDPITGLPTTAVDGRACLSPNLPAPYGTSNAYLPSTVDSPSTTAGTTGSISVTTSAPLRAVPFPIAIGNERMKVTAKSGSGTSWTLTVVRGDGTLSGSAVPNHAVGALVMSTPLPLDGSGIQMRMCIAEESWTAYPPVATDPGENDCPTALTPSPIVPVPGAPLACVLFSDRIFDIGDGTVIRAP